MEAGTYPAVCVGIIDLGEQYSERFKKFDSKILIIWEIPSQRVQVDGEDKPRWLSQEYTASLSAKGNLRPMLVSWRGAEFTEDELTEDANGFVRFSMRDMLGTGCLVQVIVKETESGKYNRVTSAIGLPVGMDAPRAETDLMFFDMDAWDNDVFQKLPQWLQDKIKKSTEYQEEHIPTDETDVDLSSGGEENPI